MEWNLFWDENSDCEDIALNDGGNMVIGRDDHGDDTIQRKNGKNQLNIPAKKKKRPHFTLNFKTKTQKK